MSRITDWFMETILNKKVLKNEVLKNVEEVAVTKLECREVSKGILTDFWRDPTGLPNAVVLSGEFEFLDSHEPKNRRTLTVKDLGELGKAFIDAKGTGIDAYTPVDLTIVFNDRP